MKVFEEKELEKIYKPQNVGKGGNGQITIIGGSRLFHGAPLLSLKVASRIVDMVFFSSPEPSLGGVAVKIKSKLSSFIWVSWDEVKEYIKKSDAVLIGPGLMRYHKKTQDLKRKTQNLDKAGLETKEITERLLRQFPNKQWVIDAGSLQVMEPKFISSEARNKVLAEGKVLIPKNAILTPNEKEFRMLFGKEITRFNVLTHRNKQILELLGRLAKQYQCVIVLKTPQTIVCSSKECVLVKGGSVGLTKGGMGDVLAGLTVALAAKNEPFLAASAAAYIVKKTADELYKRVGFAYNADDLAQKVPKVLGKYFR